MIPKHKEDGTTSTVRAVVGGLAACLIMFLSVFASAGRWDYWQGWSYFVLYLSIPVLMKLFVPDEVIKERRNPGPGAKRGNRGFLLLSFVSIFTIPIVSGLDAGRFEWTGPVPPAVSVVSFFTIVISYVLIIGGMRVNTFFSSVVRIQTDRGHRVVEEGPYAVVRHPGYAGAVLFALSTPLALGSVAGLVPAFLMTAAIIGRTIHEDFTLQRELPGYPAYAQKVKYRLFPGIW